MRNIYDLAVSMYYQFADNIDADVGRGRNVDHYFRSMSKYDGLSAIIGGMSKPDFVWKGIGPHAWQMALMLEFAQGYPCWVSSYEQITEDKSAQIRSLAAFLDIELSEARLQNLVEASSFAAMKATAERNNQGSHFRSGRAGNHAQELGDDHIEQIRSEIERHAPQLPDLLNQAGMSHIVYAEKPLRRC